MNACCYVEHSKKCRTVFTRALLQTTIKGMPFDEWGDPGTIYKVLYIRKRTAPNVIVQNDIRLARKAWPPNFRLTGTFWVSKCSSNIVSQHCSSPTRQCCLEVMEQDEICKVAIEMRLLEIVGALMETAHWK
jgi:hypothetical protein